MWLLTKGHSQIDFTPKRIVMHIHTQPQYLIDFGNRSCFTLPLGGDVILLERCKTSARNALQQEKVKK